MAGRQVIELGLQRINSLLSALGDPHHNLACIHVAGTNGKGSVCAFLSTALRENGFKVGRFISPHIIEPKDSITIDLKIIDETNWKDINQRIKEIIETKKIPATSFEILTAVAFLYFFEEKVDFAIIEVGLGGSLDSTNALPKTLVSVITSISLDHMNMLGNNLQSIATHKAGILKQNGTVVIAPQVPEVISVINQVAVSRSVKQIVVTPSTYHPSLPGHAISSDGLTYPLPLNGDVQLENSAVALGVLRFMQETGIEITDEKIIKGFGKTSWPGRNEWRTHPKYGRFLLDGAHNEGGAKRLRQYVDSQLPPHYQSVTWILACTRGKDIRSVLSHLLRPGDSVIATSFTVPEQMGWIQCTEPNELQELCKTVRNDVSVTECQEGWEAALNLASSKGETTLRVVAGSLYLVRDVLASLNL